MKKRILIVYPGNHSFFNPFVKLLVDSLENKYIIDMNLNNFWNKKGDYDLLHIHWPEAVLNWQPPTTNLLKQLENTLLFWRGQNCPIVYTRHNIEAHYKSDQQLYYNLYQIVEMNSDTIVHLGRYSMDEYISKSKTKKSHTIIPHHIYSIYKPIRVTKKIARKHLNIPENKLVILAFGDFRSNEERDWTLKAFQTIHEKNKFLLAPNFGKHNLAPLGESSEYRLGNEFIKHNHIPYFFISADLVFIQRLKILNSGNLPMAFLFNRFVIGPNIGNVGEILKETNNFSFIPGDIQSVRNSFNNAIICLKTAKCDNLSYAKEKWSIRITSKKYADLYLSLITDNI